MRVTKLERLFLTSRTFLLPGPEDFRRFIGEEMGELPFPQRVFLEDEEATPVLGFPVLQTAQTAELRAELESTVRAEMELEAAMAKGEDLGLRRRKAAWAWAVACSSRAMTSEASAKPSCKTTRPSSRAELLIPSIAGAGFRTDSVPSSTAASARSREAARPT